MKIMQLIIIIIDNIHFEPNVNEYFFLTYIRWLSIALLIFQLYNITFWNEVS